MNLVTKLQILAGLMAVIALPLMYSGLHNGSVTVPWLGIVLFLMAMLVTPILRILPARLTAGKECADV